MLTSRNLVLLSEKSRKERGFLQSYIQRRIELNKNMLAVFLGSTGSGKSYAAMKLGEILDDRFNVDRVVFSANEFLGLLNGKPLRKGSVVMWDEVGVGLNSKQWYSKFNQIINYVLQVFRRRNLIVLFTTPDFGFIDSDTRKLLHGYFITRGINPENKLCYVKFYELQSNPLVGKIYHKFLRGNQKGIRPVSQIAFGLPSEQLIKDYEKKKKDFDVQLVQGGDKTLRDFTPLKGDKLAPMEQRVLDLRRAGESFSSIAEKLKLPNQSYVRLVVNKLEKRGISTMSDVLESDGVES